MLYETLYYMDKGPIVHKLLWSRNHKFPDGSSILKHIKLMIIGVAVLNTTSLIYYLPRRQTTTALQDFPEECRREIWLGNHDWTESQEWIRP